jgi:diaminohydroxyphosphoribosylaminopyrimidine deaminase / 5-amino-6-(5-phosphoribosylamino)uracil reductase
MPTAAQLQFDRRMMTIALEMARRGLGTTAPNPSVGAVVADEATGEVISRGHTQPGGRPHAEKEALARAGARARGKTLYVTLEPCAHTGRVPTCSDSVISAGIARVVCALPDPNPVVAGHGFEQLREAGIEIDVGRLGGRARWITLGHILRQTEKRPFVQIKMGLSADGRIARGDGQPVWVTGPEARADGHLLRAEADAILVGGMTVRADDPELTCRLPGLAARSPIRIVLSPRLGLPLESKIVSSARTTPTWLVTGTPSGHTDAALSAAGVQLVHVPEALMGAAGMPAVLHTLAVKGITRLLIEGGPRTWRACLDSRLVDEAIVYQSREPVTTTSPSDTIQVIPDGGMDAWFSLFRLARVDTETFGTDTRHVFRRVVG